METTSLSISKPLCIELVATIYGWIWAEYEDDLAQYGGFFDYGTSYLEWGCYALVVVGVFKYDEKLLLYRPIIALEAVHAELSFKEFDETDLNHLLHAFCFREMDMQQELGSWNETFNVPDRLARVVELLSEAGYVQTDDQIANWCPDFLPWLAASQAINFAELPTVEPQVAQEAWDDLPDELKTLVLGKPGTKPENNLVFLCQKRDNSGWSQIAGRSSIPTRYWDVPLVYAALRIGLRSIRDGS
ncbi:MAG: hypothetical protein ABJP79_00770 [Tateyamaria sp.]|uniref:hypothetical protein n=1 Tax=Tateyamaria sp. TaxID=1929288 RepID=UPI00329F35B5